MIRLWVTTALVLLPIDAVWLTVMAQPFYRAHIGHLLAPDFAVAPAVAFYLLYVSGIVALAQRGAADWREAGLRGAMLGLVAYGTYDLTNLATLRNWSVGVTLLDMAWGVVISALASTGGYALSVYMEP
jgi:uncharacterized membrane protein